MAGNDFRVPTVVSSHSHVWRAQKGFTLVELVAVLLILGVLGAVAATRFFDRQTFDSAAFTDQARAMLRHAQKVAVAQNRDVFVRLDLKSVAICFDAACSPAGRLEAPSGSNSGSGATTQHCSTPSWYCEAVPAGIAYSIAPAAAVPYVFYYDAQGKPYTAADAPGSAVSTFPRLALIVTGDGTSRSVTVEPETGYVH